MLTACAWRDTLAGAPPVVTGIRMLLGGWLGIGRVTVGMARQGYDPSSPAHRRRRLACDVLPSGPGR
jgi:hypothetical protein